MSPKTIITNCILIITFFTLASSYSIEGPWKLEIDSSYKNISPQASIVFDFKKSIQNGKISYDLNVLACSLIQFKYALNNSEIAFTLTKIGANRRQCQKDEVSQIISRMEKVVYTSTINNVLLFLAPSGKTILKFTKVDSGKALKNLADIWQAVQIDGQPTSVIIRANSTNLQFCGGNASVEYNITKPNVIDLKIRQSKGCPQNKLLTSIYRSHYVRSRGDWLYFYNQNADLLMKWNNLGDYGENQPIVFQNNAVKKIIMSDNTMASGSTDMPKGAGSGPVVNGQSNVLSTQIYSQFMPAAAPTVTKSVKNQDSLEPVRLVVPSQPTYNNNPINIQRPQPSQPSPSPPLPISVSTASQPSYLTAIKKQDIFAKWYLVGSAQQTMMIITSNRLMVYGDCGVWFSIINLSDAQTGNINVFNSQAKNSLADCLGKNNRLQYQLSSLHHLTIREGTQGQKYIQFWNKQNKILGEWANSKQK